MPNLTIEITAPTIVPVLEKLIATLNPKTFAQSANGPIPQTPEELAAKQRIAPPPIVPAAPVVPYPAYDPRNPKPQSVSQIYPQTPVPSQYRPMQPQTPVNPMPTAPIQTPAVPPMNSANAAPQQTVPIQQAPIAAAPAYSLDDLARSASQLMDAGKQQDLIALLGQFGIQTLGALPKERFGEFATALRQLGAHI